MDEVLGSVAKVPQSVASVLENISCTDDKLSDLLRAVVRDNDEIYGATIAFEPYMSDSGRERYAPYFYKDTDGDIRFSDLAGESYNYLHSDWYQIPRALEHPVWSEPYFDEGGGGVVMSTYSVPFYRIEGAEKILAGIVTADISLSWLQKIIASIRIAETGYGFVITKNGTYVVHPNERIVMNETIFSLAEGRGDQGLRELGRAMIHGESGFVPFRSTVTEKMCWMVYAPSEASGWSAGVLFPQNELMADVTHMNRTVLAIGIVGLLFLCTVIVLIAQTITRPLRLLAGAARTIATGDLDGRIPRVKARDEVGELAESLDYMKVSLKKYIEDLTEATAARERIEGELQVAHDIQMGILPKVYPPFPDRPEFELYAMLQPAKEVGGDLYDFFFLDDDHLCFLVGDVSGKGVPASLFMAITKTLIKTKATKGISPEAILGSVNQDLSVDNPSLMFVTLFLGILNIRTGKLIYCNGGHNPPYVIRSDGTLETIETTNGMALGVMEDFLYQSKTLTLGMHDTLMLYTDGVTEAMNERHELFSEQRLEDILLTSVDTLPQELIRKVLEMILEYCRDVEQTDDITMLAIRFNG